MYASGRTRLLKQGLVLFWAFWLSLVLLTNLFDGLKALGIVAEQWTFASGNYAFVVAVTAIFGTPSWINSLLFVGVILWQAVAAACLWQAWWSVRGKRRAALHTLDTAFAVNLALWAAFMLADEFFIAYESGVEATHMRIFAAQLITLLAVHLLPE